MTVELQIAVQVLLGQADGKNFMIPIGVSTPSMLVNVDLFKSVGLDVENFPKSWDEVRKASEKLKAAGKMGVLWGWSVTGNWIYQAMLDNAGGALVDKTGKKTAFNSPAGLKTLKYMVDLAADGLMPVTDQTLATFLTGNLGMLVDSSFQRINTPKQAKFNIRFLPMPTPDGKTPKVPAGGNGAMMFSKTPEQQQAAWKMIRWLTEAEASTKPATTASAVCGISDVSKIIPIVRPFTIACPAGSKKCER